MLWCHFLLCQDQALCFGSFQSQLNFLTCWLIFNIWVFTFVRHSFLIFNKFGISERFNSSLLNESGTHLAREAFESWQVGRVRVCVFFSFPKLYRFFSVSLCLSFASDFFQHFHTSGICTKHDFSYLIPESYGNMSHTCWMFLLKLTNGVDSSSSMLMVLRTVDPDVGNPSSEIVTTLGTSAMNSWIAGVC